MQALSVFCFGLLALAVTADYCSTGSSFPKDCQNRQKDCGLLLGGGKKHPGSGESKTTTPAAASTTVSFVSSTHGECECTCSGESSGSDESSGSGSDESSGSSEEGSGLLPYDDYCLLLQYFYNISFEITDVEIYEAWIIFIHECQYEIIYDESLTIEEKLVAIWAKLEIFIEIHIEIKYIVLYTYISEWSGFIFDLEAVSLFVQYQFTETIVELDVSGNCVLFESLLNATSGNSALYAKVEILIQELRLILEVETYTYAYKLVLIYEKIQAFFVQYSSYELTILEIEIEGYGYFSSFYEVCANYWRVYYYSIAVGGSASSCELVQVLTAAYQNTSCGSSAQRAQIKQFVTDLTTYFSSNTDVEARVEFFVSEFYQFIILQEWSIEIIFSLEIEGYGSIYELILAYSFEFNFGPFDFGSQTTTVAPTTHATGQCSLSSQIVAFASNTSDLSWSIDYAQQGWNSTQISRFAAYKQRIWTVTGNSTATSQEIIANVVNVFNKWTTNTYYLDLVYSIQIYVFHATSQQYYWGTVQQFCDCNA